MSVVGDAPAAVFAVVAAVFVVVAVVKVVFVLFDDAVLVVVVLVIEVELRKIEELELKVVSRRILTAYCGEDKVAEVPAPSVVTFLDDEADSLVYPCYHH